MFIKRIHYMKYKRYGPIQIQRPPPPPPKKTHTHKEHCTYQVLSKLCMSYVIIKDSSWQSFQFNVHHKETKYTIYHYTTFLKQNSYCLHPHSLFQDLSFKPKIGKLRHGRWVVSNESWVGTQEVRNVNMWAMKPNSIDMHDFRVHTLNLVFL